MPNLSLSQPTSTPQGSRASGIWILPLLPARCVGGERRVVFEFTTAGERIIAIDLIADAERIRQLDLAILGG